MTDDVCKLISRKEVGKNSHMKPVYEEIGTDVLCTSVPVSRSEFFSAGQIGINPEVELIINPIEYCGQKIVEFHGKRMNIYRTYKSSEDELELYCQLAIGLNGGRRNDS